MKTLEEYMKLPYRMEIEEDTYEGGYVVSFPDLPGCLTCAESFDEILPMATDAKRIWFEAAIEDGVEIQEPRNIDSYSGKIKIHLPKSLHQRLSEHAKSEGISMNQYCVYLLTNNDTIFLSNKLNSEIRV